MRELFLRWIAGRRAGWIAVIALLAALTLIFSGQWKSDTPPDAPEARMEKVLSCVAGAGKVRVLIGEGEAPGVVVVAEGAGDIAVALELQRAVRALTGAELSQIEVLKMSEGES